MVNLDLPAVDDRVSPCVPDTITAFLPGGTLIHDTLDACIGDMQVVRLGIGRQVEIRPVDPVGSLRSLLPERIRQGETEIPGIDPADQEDFAFVLHGFGVR